MSVNEERSTTNEARGRRDHTRDQSNGHDNGDGSSDDDDDDDTKQDGTEGREDASDTTIHKKYKC